MIDQVGQCSQTKTVLGLLTLLGLRGIGPALAERLACKFESPEAVMDARPTDLNTIVPSQVVETIRDSSNWSFARAKAMQTLERAERLEPPCNRRLTSISRAARASLQNRPDLSQMF
jgi:NAD-dependent DNA ligase